MGSVREGKLDFHQNVIRNHHRWDRTPPLHWILLAAKQPLLELRAFKSVDFTRGIIISWIMQAAMFGSVLLFPLLLQQIKGFTPLTTGLILLPQAVGSMIFMPMAGKLFDKVGARPRSWPE